MAFCAVLDTCVLYPFSLRDTLLRLAEAELYDVVLSAQILDEMEEVLVRDGVVEAESASRMRSLIEGAFEGSIVNSEAVDKLIAVVTNEEHDRHVLATAIAGGAEAIVTENLTDFPTEACDPWDVNAMSADEFLCVLFHKDPRSILQILKDQAGSLRNPPKSLDELLEMLERAGANEFVEAVKAELSE